MNFNLLSIFVLALFTALSDSAFLLNKRDASPEIVPGELGLPNELSQKFLKQYERRSASRPTRGTGKNSVCIVVASLPWRFGPYQNQAWKLSVSLDALGFDVQWLAFSSAHAIRRGTYTSAKDLYRHHKHLDLPPDGFKENHLTYLGFFVDDGLKSDSTLSVRELNRIAEVYDIKNYLILTDTTRIARDVTSFEIPAMMWLPHHHATVRPIDLHTLDVFSMVVTLNPTVASLFPRSRGRNVAYVPHIVDAPTPDERFASREFHGISRDAFVVLAQGGNYESYDRKGWVQLIQSFALFRETHTDALLYIHAIGKRSIAAMEHGGKPPAALTNEGPNLYEILSRFQIPPEAFMLDTSVHEHAEAIGLKKMADVCMHPSKTEGFGLNVLECQQLGTPVVTTEFLAMADFTRNGVSVRPQQYDILNNGLVATPDVRGGALALSKIYALDDATAAENAKDGMRWIADHFSAERVGNAFAYHIGRMKRRSPGRDGADHVDFVSDAALSMKPWTVVYSADSVVLDRQRIEMLLETKLPADNIPPMSIIPVRGSVGFDPTFVDEDSDVPFAILVRTLYYIQASTFFHSPRMRLGWAISKITVRNLGTMPDGLARSKGDGDEEWAEWEL